DEEGSLEGSLVTLTDITAIKRSERIERILADAGEAFATSLNPQDTAIGLASLLVPDLADFCVVGLVEGSEIRTAAVLADPPQLTARLRDLVERDGPAAIACRKQLARVVRTGQAVVDRISEAGIREIATDDDHLRLLESLDVRSELLVPIPSRGGAAGVMVLGLTDPGRRFGERTISLVVEV